MPSSGDFIIVSSAANSYGRHTVIKLPSNTSHEIYSGRGAGIVVGGIFITRFNYSSHAWFHVE